MKPNANHAIRAVFHPGMLALDGATVRIQTQTCDDGGTRLSFLDPNTDMLLASVGFTDGPNGRTFAHCAIRCTAREQNASFRREGE